MKQSNTKLYIGTAGWQYADWNDIVYEKSEKNKLKFLSQYFNVVEINTTFYHPIKPSFAEKWISDVDQNDEFTFAVKLWQRFTHSKEDFTEKEVNIFKYGIKPLENKNRLFLLVQFPFFFENIPQNIDRIKKILDNFSEYNIIIEVRHKSFEESSFYKLLKDSGASLCGLDYPIASSSFSDIEIINDNFFYYRLHGRNYKKWFKRGAERNEKYDYLYDDNELEQIEKRIRLLIGKVKTLIIITNNHYKGQAAVNALQIASDIENQKVDVPPLLVKKYPQLKSIMIKKTDKQENLFDV